MPNETVLPDIDAVGALDEAAGKLDAAEGELILDFSLTQRIDSSALDALEKLTRAAEEKLIKVSVRGVNVKVYKVLKLTKLSQRLCFV